MSDWELLKQNGPEWLLLVIGSIAAFIQGACFPTFAVLFGYSMGVSNIPLYKGLSDCKVFPKYGVIY